MIESKLLEIIGIINQVLETCNKNVKSIQSLNSTILEFMHQMPQIGMGVGSPNWMKGQPLLDGTNPIQMVDNNKLHL
jgi:hypothetical protein